MLGNDNQNNNGKLYILKIQTRDAEKHNIDPVFQISEKNQETKKWAVTNSQSTVIGNLIKLEVKTNTPKDENYDPYESVALYLRDDDLNETYLIDTRINMLSRSIFNSLLALEKFDEIKLSLYTNKNGYATASVRQHGTIVNWKYSLEEVPQPLEVTFKGKIQRDYTPTDTFFLEKLKELGAKLGGGSTSLQANARVESFGKAKQKSKKEVEPENDVDLEVGALVDDSDVF